MYETLGEYWNDKGLASEAERLNLPLSAMVYTKAALASQGRRDMVDKQAFLDAVDVLSVEGRCDQKLYVAQTYLY